MKEEITPNEYLYNRALEAINNFDDSYHILEVGTDAGTTAMCFLKALNKAKSKRWLFTVDPHGDKPYRIDGNDYGGFEYGDHKYRKHLSAESNFALENELNHLHWKIRSVDFFKVLPKVEFWSNGGIIKKWKFCFVYLDGEHSWDTILEEIKWVYPKIPKGGVIVIDDYNLIGDEATCREKLKTYKGDLEFSTLDEHYRIYITKK